MNCSLFKVFMSKDVIVPVNNILLSGYITQGNGYGEKIVYNTGKRSRKI